MEFDGGVGSPASLVPSRIRRRLSRSSGSGPSSVEEIEAKLNEAGLRREQFYKWLSSKARTKPRSPPSSSSQEEDLGQRLEAKLHAAEQKRLSLLAKAQVRLARLDEIRQAAKTGVAIRTEKAREELGTKVESRVQQAEANRMRLLKAYMQRRAAAHERTAKSLLQRVSQENNYKEHVHSTILQKRAAAEKKRMGLLQAEKLRARARVMQVHRVAKTVSHQRESEQRRIKEQLENRLQRAKRQRAEFLKQRRNPHRSTHTSLNKHGEFLSRKLARCWKRFVKSRKTTFALAKAFEALDINEKSAKSLSFEHLSLRLQSAMAVQTVKALLDRLETRFLLSQSSSSSSPENIDRLLTCISSPNKKTSSSKTTRNRGPAKRNPLKETRSSEANKLSRYAVKVVLSAYMILGHPSSVFSEQGESEIALKESSENFVRELESLIEIMCSHPFRKSSPDVLSDKRIHESAQFSRKGTFKSQLTAFDTAWCSYLHQFVVWKFKDARALEDHLVRTACQLELSMMQKCKLTAQGQICDLTHDMKVIQRQVNDDQKLLRKEVLLLTGNAGIERMECALSDTRSRFFEAKESGIDLMSPVPHIFTPSSSKPSTSPTKPATKNLVAEKNGMPSPVVRALFGNSSSEPNVSTETNSVEVRSSFTVDKQLPPDNELLVNEIIHGGVGTFINNNEDASDIKAKFKETMEKAFWDGIMESMKQDEPDYGRIVNLVKGVRDELCEMAPQSWKQEVLDNIDLDILSQVFESGTQDTDYLGRILEYALIMLQKLSAPMNDEKMKKVCNKLLSELAGIVQSDDKQSSSFFLATIKGLRFVLEHIQTLKMEINKARIQLMEPIIKGSAGVEYLQKAFSDCYGPPSCAANSLPLTVQWISSLGTKLEEEWSEHTNCLATLPTNNGLPLVTVLRTGGDVPFASKQSHPPVVSSGSEEQPGCNGEKVDILVRFGLLKLANEIEGLTVDTVPETIKLNAMRMRALQSQLQQIIVISTSMLLLRQILVNENATLTHSELESTISDSLRRLSELLDTVADVGILKIIDAIFGSSPEQKIQSRREVMGRLLTKSLQSDDDVFKMVSRSIYLAMRGVVLGGSGTRGRALADAALRRTGASMLLERVVSAAETLIVMARVSARVHGPWYRSLA